MTIERWYTKANAYAAAWRGIFGADPIKNAVVLGLSVAEHETRCGDDWAGENNWGAVQDREPTADELDAVSGIPPHPSNVEEARAAIAVHGYRTAGFHADYTPRKPAHYYWVYFATFATEAEGAARCVHVLAEQRPTCRNVLMDPLGSEHALAERMRATGYYEGFRNPKGTYEYRDGAWHEVQPSDPAQGPRRAGNDLNIDDYAGALSKLTPGIRAALAQWTPGAQPPVAPDARTDIATVRGQQHALNILHMADPPLGEDGIPGPRTLAAVRRFQLQNGLEIDGIVGPKTFEALRKALA